MKTANDFARDNIKSAIENLHTIMDNMFLDQLFISIWKKHFNMDSEFENKRKEYNERHRKLQPKVEECYAVTNAFYMEFIGKGDLELIDPEVIKSKERFSKNDDNLQQIIKEYINLRKLFIELWELYDEEAEIPLWPELPVIELTKLIDPKKYDEWKDTG